MEEDIEPQSSRNGSAEDDSEQQNIDIYLRVRPVERPADGLNILEEDKEVTFVTQKADNG
jgi:hypothetical protein